MRDFKKCDITYLLRKIDLEMLPHLKKEFIPATTFTYILSEYYCIFLFTI